MSLHSYLKFGLVLSLALAACSTAGTNTSPTSAPAATAGGVSATSAATAAPAQGSPMPAPSGMPPQSKAADIRPPERRAELTRLSNLLQFQVTGVNNAALGKISDYIINTCETYIVYFLVSPDSALALKAGSQLVIPFEAVTINSGALDAAAKAIVVQLTPDELKAAPASANAPVLLPANTWEDAARSYWKQWVRVGKLSSTCNTGGGATQKIAYATQLIGADLKDGNGALIGSVQDAILEPESGKLGFYVVGLANNQGSLLLPLAQTNIPEEALKPGAKISLVLLADPAKVAGAPRLTSADQATDDNAQSAARGYWGS